MKKLSALLICLALILCCAAAPAESANLTTVDIQGRFRLTGVLPEGYQFSITSQSDLLLEGTISSSDPAAPVMLLSVSFNETYADVRRLNDLPRENLEVIKQGFSAENQVTFDTAFTSLGTELLVVREVGADRDFLDFYSIYLGHEIELTLYPGEEAPDHALSDQQVQMCIDFLSALDFVPVE